MPNRDPIVEWKTLVCHEFWACQLTTHARMDSFSLDTFKDPVQIVCVVLFHLVEAISACFYGYLSFVVCVFSGHHMRGNPIRIYVVE